MDPLTYKKMILPIKDKLYRLAKMMLQTREEAEDALQDVLLKLWDNRQSLAGYRSVEALAMRMTKNQCLNRLKSPQYRRSPDAHAVEVGSPELPPDRSLEVHDSLRLMQRTGGALPPQQQLVMHLRNVEGYSYEEIEEIRA
jgi:RNA polymerase sigma-70 factor (ECF subfamily)